MSINANDPRLTAYALGELDDAERAQVEKLLEQSPEARAAVEEIRQTAELLTGEFASEPVAALTAEQRGVVEVAMRESDAGPAVAKAGRVRLHQRRWVPYAVAASIVLLVGVPLGSLLVPSLSGAREMARQTAAPEFVGGLRGIGQGTSIYALDSREWFASNQATGPSAETTFLSRFDFSGHSGLSYAYQVPYGRRGRPGETLDGRMALSADKGPYLRRGLWLLVTDSPSSGYYICPSADGWGDDSAQAFDTEAYDSVVHNPFLHVMQNPLSTFSIDVDTASYANVRRFLNGGQLPPPGAVRVEEMINYFTYDYPAPSTGETPVPHEDTADTAVPHEHPFSVNVEIGECPWTPVHRLMRVGLKGLEFEPEERPSCNLVFLIDVSGSMQPANKLPLVKEALDLLVGELYDDDRVAMVVYAGSSGLVLPSTTGGDAETIREALERLEAGGSTNGGAGIQLAYDVAADNFIDGGANRVILATDGDFNVGITDRSELVRLIEEKARSGVFLSVLGFGMGNLKDSTLEQLADKGNGNYAYIDTLNEARKVLVEQLGGTLVTIAKDVKIQIEFNPTEVAAYRLIGYENRLLAAQDFSDDTKDAGEIGAGHTVTALYELVPVGVEPPVWEGAGSDVNPPEAGARWESRTSGESRTGDEETGVESDYAEADDGGTDANLAPDPHALAQTDALPNLVGDPEVDPLRYQTPGNLAAAALGISEGEVATVKLRYKLPDGDASQLLEVPVIDDGATLAEMSEDFRFAASVASFGMLLRDSPYVSDWTYGAVLELAIESLAEDVHGYRAEFVELVERAKELAGE